jgi:hypothetical protein
MKSNLKVLGLALAAVFAMSALAAGSASAAKYHSEVETTWTHSHTTSVHIFHTNVGTVTCETTTTTSHTTGTGSGSDWTTTTTKSAPTYSKCTAFGFPAEVKMNGCEYEFLEPNASLVASSKILCPTGKTIEIVAVGFCTMTVGAQSPGGTVAFTNEGSGSSRVVKTVSSVSSIVYGGNCGSGTNGTYTGTSTVKGYKNEGLTEQVGIWVG